MGGKTTTSTNTVKIPQEVLDRYNAVNTQAQQVAQNPFQKYGTQASDFVAQFNPQQNQGIAGINTVAGMGPAYNNVENYLSPYIKNVADTTRAQMQQSQEQAQSGALGTAVQSGAFGGDRAGVAAANLANQNQMAMGSTMANIYNQGYGQAMDTSMNDMNRMLGVAGQQLGAGTQMQQTEQAGKDALINQFQQEQGFPFQVAQFLANIAMGTGALTGSTTTAVNQGSFFSDRRLKHDIKEIGKAHNGMPIYTFKYKGDPEQHTHVGFMADEVEKKNPEAVGLDPSGYKTVDYDKATQSMGGGVHARHAGEAFADGGVAGPYGSKVGQGVGAGSYIPEAYLPVGELMVADPTMAAQKTQGVADLMEAAANTGKSLTQLDESFGPDGKFYKIFDKKKAYGGGVQPEEHGDYLSSTLASQSANMQKPELKTAAPSQQPESTFGNIVKLASTVAPFFLARGGVAGDRHGYAVDGMVRDPEVERRRLLSSDIPAAQTLGSLPNATVQNATAAPVEPVAPVITTPIRTQGLGGADAYREAATRRFEDTPSVTSSPRPLPRPEGLAAAAAPQVPAAQPEGLAAAPVRPMPRPEGLEQVASGYEAAREHYRTKVVPTESGGRQFDPETGLPLTSPKGAVGAGQVMEATGPEAAALAGVEWDRDRWLNDEDYNLKIGEAYYLDQYRKFGSLDKADAAYNFGPTALRAAINKAAETGNSYFNELPAETQQYLIKNGTMPEGVGGSRTSVSTMGGDQPAGGVKPYDDRNTLGKMVYDREGKVDKNAMLSLFAGLGDMLSSPSPFLLPSIGAGISGAANTYMAREGQVANIQNTQLDMMKKVSDETARYNERYGTNFTTEEYRQYALNINKPPPDGLTGTGTANISRNSFMGVPLNTYGGGLNEMIKLPDGTYVRAADHMPYLERLLAEQQKPANLEAVPQSAVDNTVRLIADINAKGGSVPVLNEDGTQALDENNKPIFTTDPTVMAAQQAKVATILGEQKLTTLSDDNAVNQNVSTNVDNLVKSFAAASQTGRTGIFNDLYALGSAVFEGIGRGDGAYAALNDEVRKGLAEFETAGGPEQTDLERRMASGALPGLTKQAAANAWILATMQAQAKREQARIAAVGTATNPAEAYYLNRDSVNNFDMKGEVKKFYEENLNKLGTFDPTQPNPEDAAAVPAITQSAIDAGVSAEAWENALPSERALYP
jgi:hypothetical protein